MKFRFSNTIASLLFFKVDKIEAASQIRAAFGIPVIFLSAFSDEDQLARASKAEPYGYLIKPVDERQLRITVEMPVHRAQLESKHRKAEKYIMKPVIQRELADKIRRALEKKIQITKDK